MLAIVEDCLAGLRASRSDRDISSVLGEFARSVGFRSSFILEYSDNAHPARALDTDPTRGDGMRGYLEADFSLSQKSVEAQPETETILRLNGERFGDDQGEQSARRTSQEHDYFEMTAFPIRHGRRAVGLAGFCGDPVLSGQTESALSLVAYYTFAQLRTGHRALSAPVDVSLTPRQRQVMNLAAAGMTSEEISRQLGMSLRTANQHIDNVADRLGTRNRTHAVAECLRRGYI